ncbi:MAG: hypothetical protein FVQ77_08040 [Cytophagales bacterium]|nr:hypothetical protein [Cytophagales bacterium]
MNKLFAVFYGPAGITLLAHFQNLLSIITTIPGDGINRGMIKYTAACLPNNRQGKGRQAGTHASSHKKNNQELYPAKGGAGKNYFVAGFWLNMIVFVITMLVLVLAKQQYFVLFLIDYSFPDKFIWFTVFIIASLFLTINLFLLSVILSKQLLRTVALITIAGSVFTIVFSGIGVLHFTITKALLVFLLGQSCAFLFSIIYVTKKKFILVISTAGRNLPIGSCCLQIRIFLAALRNGRYSSGGGWRVYKDLGKFILMALSVVLFDKMVDFFVRMYIINQYDLYQTGLWQTVVKVSDSYTMVFTAILGMVYYPKISALINNDPGNEHPSGGFRGAPTNLQKYVSNVFYLLAPSIAIALGFVFLFKQGIILLLFDTQFLGSAFLMKYQILGDFFKMSSWILAYLILAQARVGLFIATQAISAIIYVVSLYLLTPVFGLEGLTISHLIRFVLYFIFNIIYFRKIFH